MVKEEKNNNNADVGAEAGSDNKTKESRDTVTLSKREYETLRQKSEERDAFYDKYLRIQAEFENARKRLEKEKADFAKFANETFVLDFLPIIDSLEISEKHIKEAKDFKAVQEGVDMIHAQIQKFLKEMGVEKVKTIGEKFDPHLHEAVETVEANEIDEGLILEELKPGYTFNGRLLRPASVKIVKHGG